MLMKICTKKNKKPKKQKAIVKVFHSRSMQSPHLKVTEMIKDLFRVLGKDRLSFL